MSYRGRLIFPFQAQIYQLDTAATAADPDGAGPLESGYDEDFKEPITVPVAGKQVGTDARAEKDPILVKCQVEPGTFEALQQLFSGNAPNTQIGLIFHFEDLESLGLIDPNGVPSIKVGDRLGGIYDVKGNLVQEVRNPPGAFATEVRPIGFGLDATHSRRNLLLVGWGDRQRGVVA